MRLFKAVGFIALWVLLSFLSIRLGQAKECVADKRVEGWIHSYSTLNSWYHFYLNRQGCDMDISDLLKTLAGSEPLSIRLNQAKVSFDQFYVPISELLDVNWEGIDKEDDQKIQSNLSIINHSLNRAMGTMGEADKDYFRAVVLLNLPSEFVEAPPVKNGRAVISRRLNKETGRSPPRIDPKDVTPPPYERVFIPQ